MKVAVVLFNLGGPDSLAAVRPFLYNLFCDPAIIQLPAPLRKFVAWLIAKRREKTAQAIYAQMGGRSPLLPNTQAQARALETMLNEDGELGEVRCFVAMRYWHPFFAETLLQIQKFAPDVVVRLPLYPQFSTTTSGSSLRESEGAFGAVPVATVFCYPISTGFIAALAGNIRPVYEKMARKYTGAKKTRLLLSAHGLPEKIIKAGDPYAEQCQQTAAAVVAALAVEGMDWVLCYQSRVGPLKWIGPATEDEIRRAGRDAVPVVVVPVAFVSEHSETLVELGLEYRQLAAEVGVPDYAVVPAVGTAPEFIAELAKLVRFSWFPDGDNPVGKPLLMVCREKSWVQI